MPSPRQIRPKQCCLIWLLCLTLLNSYGQDYPTIQYTNRDGLAQMQVMSLLKDSRGYLWVGTKVGLSRFDGQRFENFHVKDGLLGIYAHGMAEDRRGNVWIGFRKGLVKFDGCSFTPYPAPTERFIESTGIGLAFDDRNQLFMIGTDNHRLYTLQGNTYKPVEWPELKGHPVQEIRYDPPTNALLISIQGLGIYQYQRGKLSLLTNLSKNGMWFDRRLGGYLTVNAEQPDGSYLHYCQQGKQWIPYLRQKGNVSEVLRPMPFDYLVSRLSDATVLLVEKNTDRQRVVFSLSNSNDHIQDELGFWLATEKGLVRVFTNGIRYFPENQVPYAWSVVEDRQGAMWFLNFRKQVQRFDGKTLTPVLGYREVIQQGVKASEYVGSGDDWYYQALRDKRGNLWLPNNYGVAHYDGRQFRLIRDSVSLLAMTLLEDPAHDRIIQGGIEKVLFIENKSPYRITKRLTAANGLGDGLFKMSLAKDRTDHLWIGAKGITRYDEARNRCYIYSQQNGKLPGKGVLAMITDSRDNQWAALAEGGLALYNKRTDRFSRIGADVFGECVNTVGLMDEYHLVVGDVHNLYVMDLAAFYRNGAVSVRTFNHHNGFLGLESGQNGFYKDSKGFVWMPSGTVLSRLDPRQLDQQTRPLKPHITHVDGQRLPFAQTDSTLTIPYGQNRLKVTFDAIGYDQPFQTQFSYRIPQVDTAWSAWQTDNNAVLSSLASGRYTLELKARTGSQMGGRPVVALLAFAIAIPFWKSPNFYRWATAFGTLLLLMAGFLWARERRGNRQLKIQSRLLAEQETRVRFLQIQTIQAQMSPHFTFNVLASLQSMIDTNDRVLADQHLVNLSKLIRNFLESTLLPDDKQTGSLYAHEIPLAKELELLRMYVEFEQLQFGNPFRFECIVDTDIAPDMCQIPPLLIQPYVENAVKHGLKTRPTASADRPGYLSIRFAKTDEILTCTIEDNGIGREAARRLKAQSLRAHQSRGTELVQKRVEILNQVGYFISIETSDLLGGGTVVVISIGYDL